MSEIYFAETEGCEYQIEILSDTHISINDISFEIDFEALRQDLAYSLLINGESYEVSVYQENGEWIVTLRGNQFSVTVLDDLEKRLRAATELGGVKQGAVSIQAPMPGLVIDVPVAEGDQVNQGEVLVVLESMKMQNELRAPRAGKVSNLQVKVNDNVDRKHTLLTLD
jgi:acetyl/propionyl-CoA carboxylase alpha subunit